MGKHQDISAFQEYPQLADIRDKLLLQEKLEKYARDSSGLSISSCYAKRVYYRPGKECRVLIEATIAETSGEIFGKQLYFGRIHPGKAPEAFEAFNRESLSKPVFGEALLMIPEWELVLLAFPNDPNIPGISFMSQAAEVLAAMQTNPGDFGLAAAPEKLTALLKKHVPGKRCCYGYTVSGKDLAAEKVIFGKAYQEKEGPRAYAIHKGLWDSPQRQAGGFFMSEPYSFDRERVIVWKEMLSGRSLAKSADMAPRFPALAKEIGRQLAALHQVEMDLPVTLSIDAQIAGLKKTAGTIRKGLPAYGDTGDQLVAQLLDEAAMLPLQPNTLVHASFKFSHIFLSDERISIVDFDGVTIGDPGYDLGRFLARLYRMQVSGKISAEIARQTATAFCEAYNAAATHPLPQRRIDWYAASHLVISELNRAVKRTLRDDVDGLLALTRQFLLPAA